MVQSNFVRALRIIWIAWSGGHCEVHPHDVRYSAGRRMKPILRAAPRLPCNEPATGKGSAKLHAASSHAYRTSLQQVIVYRRTRTPPPPSRAASNNGMHPTRDTPALIFLKPVGGRVTPGVRRLLYS